MRQTVGALISATDTAERAIAGLKLTLGDCDRTLAERLRTAERYAADLAAQVEAGQAVMERIGQIVSAATLVAPKAEPRLRSRPQAPTPVSRMASAAAVRRRDPRPRRPPPGGPGRVIERPRLLPAVILGAMGLLALKLLAWTAEPYPGKVPASAPAFAQTASAGQPEPESARARQGDRAGAALAHIHRSRDDRLGRQARSQERTGKGRSRRRPRPPAPPTPTTRRASSTARSHPCRQPSAPCSSASARGARRSKAACASSRCASACSTPPRRSSTAASAT